MEWTLKQKSWRAVLIRMALLTALWLVVTFVFATELYLSARGGPIKISWTVAAASAFRDWCPWILLSPVAVILAGKFRFGRDTWRRSVMIHIAACILFTIAYQGLLVLAYPAPYFLSTGNMVGITATSKGMPFGLPGVGGTVSITSALDGVPHGPRPVTVPGEPSGPLFPASSNAGVVEPDNTVGVGVGSLAPSGDSNTVFVTRSEATPSFVPQTDGVTTEFHVGFWTRGSAGKWAPFLQMAMLRTQFTVPIYLCIVCVCWVINHFQEASERERRTLELETRLTQANLQALKMQLQPHFLFNTLNSISSLIHENPKVADDMIGSLSQFLRTTLDISAKNEVPLRTELESP
jgi:hypothetical protein